MQLKVLLDDSASNNADNPSIDGSPGNIEAQESVVIYEELLIHNGDIYHEAALLM